MNFLLLALRRWADQRPDATAFVEANESISYGQLWRRVGGLAQAAADLPAVVGLLAPNGIDWLVADLGLWASGRIVVPLPLFFSDAQLGNVISDAGVEVILTTEASAARVAALRATARLIGRAEGAVAGTEAPAGRRIIYTSGSTGRPKGVILGPGQLRHTCDGLLDAVKPGIDDRHLSVLPFPMLLENICGIYVPILAGGEVHIAADILSLPALEIAVALAEAALACKASTTVLVPQLLTAWVLIASVGRVAVPDSLRFVAVGGAPVPQPIALRARELGIPAYEGYGLSECSSVVAVNVPGAERLGSVGRPIAGLGVTIADDGEIVVQGASVMQGYHGGGGQAAAAATAPESWRTGDLGHLDADGYLFVHGRKDNLIVIANGRNISPEWVETMLSADPRIGRAIVLPGPNGLLVAILEASLLGQHWFEANGDGELQELAASLCSAAPSYAVPRRCHGVASGYFAAHGLLTANQRPRRAAIHEHFAASLAAAMDKDTAYDIL